MIPLKDNVPTEHLPIVTIALIVVNILVFVWQLSFSSSTDYSPAFPGVSERDENTIQYGAIPYRILHPSDECALGAVKVSPTEAEPGVVCQGTPDYREAVSLHAENRASIPTPQPLDAVPWLATIFTSMFMHGGFLHIFFNMLFLWIFGNNVEDTMGRVPFLLFYLLGGVVAVYGQAALDPSSTLPTIGASGAVAAVLGAYLILLPRARVISLVFLIFIFTLIEVPAYVILGIWFLLQFLPAIGQVSAQSAGEGGVAYFAHVAGFIFGLAVAWFLLQRRPRGPRRTTEPPYPVY